MKILILIFVFIVFTIPLHANEKGSEKSNISPTKLDAVKKKLLLKYGESQRFRIAGGVDRVAAVWWEKDGNESDFETFCLENFIADEKNLDQTFLRIERNFEVVNGFTHQINRTLSAPTVLNLGDPLKIDSYFSKVKPQIDYFKNKLAFFIRLNFPHFTLEDKIKHGTGWDRKQWAMVRIGDMFESRIPEEVNNDPDDSSLERRRYFNTYFFYMNRMLTPDRRLLFPDELRLNSHHGLREEIRAQYINSDGFQRQELIYNIILRIIDQSTPVNIINNQDYYWDPQNNLLFTAEGGKYTPIPFESEGNRRYYHFLQAVNRKKKNDPYHPQKPTVMQRTFERSQLPEDRVVQILTAVMSSPEARDVAQLIQKRIGRKLRPYDMWYNGFQAQGTWSEKELNKMLKQKYPTPKSFEDDIVNILLRLGFSEERANFLRTHIAVDPVSTGGHASGAAMRGDKAHLRTVFQNDGLDYKGYRIGMHELGHCVASNLSLYEIDYYFLRGLPTSSFHEGIADLFAYRNIKAQGLGSEDPLEKYMNTLAIFWYVYEKCGNAYTDIKVWHWLYENPQPTADDLKEAVITIAKDVWNQYYAPVFGVKDSPILSIYNHMVSGSLYLYNYALGNISLLQLEDFLLNKDLEKELVRICSTGSLTPDLWIQKAVGSQFSAKPLLKATRAALQFIK
jgi:hypothetical protein